eukprot:SAG31_NODE_22725_length_519_cov_0.976190_1_plen_33_part_01
MKKASNERPSAGTLAYGNFSDRLRGGDPAASSS